MKHIVELIGKYIDFHFALALIAILGTAGFLCLQFNEASTEFDTLNASMYSVVHGQRAESRENASLNYELDELGKSLDDLKF